LGVAEANAEMVLKRCEPMDKTQEAGVSATLVNEFVHKSHEVLDRHDINKKRVAEGKLKANVIITRDAGDRSPELYDINKKYDISFACLADMPVEKGIAKLAGMRPVDLPPPSEDQEKDCVLRVNKLLDVLPVHNCFYIHLKGPDIPGHDGDFDLKTELIETIDEHFVGNLLRKIELEETVFCITSDHSTPCKLKAHSDDPVPTLISGNKIEGDDVKRFSEKHCREGGLGVLARGTELMPMLVKFLKERRP
jgi:2,3-bisphosphoglycerate-independent phosphoglycerate mutase